MLGIVLLKFPLDQAVRGLAGPERNADMQADTAGRGRAARITFWSWIRVMPSLIPLNILIASDEPQQIKLITITMRGFFSECRVDAVYSADEALHWAAKEDWHVILVDEPLLVGHDRLIAELKHRLPAASVILQSERSDSSAALSAMHGGADFYIFKKSSAFLTELLFVAQEAIEKRDLLLRLHHVEERQRRLLETLPDVLYELDPEGRFVFVSPAVTALLGYRPDELKGMAYSEVLPPDQLPLARHRFNDRRAGPRAAQRVALDMRPKRAPNEGPGRVMTEVSARGLYDSHRRFLGTLGIIRNVSAQRQQEAALHRMEQERREIDRFFSMARAFMAMSQAWHRSVTGLTADAERLMRMLERIGLENQLRNLLTQSAEADRAGRELAERLAQSVTGAPAANLAELIGQAAIEHRTETGLDVAVDLSPISGLPSFRGDAARVKETVLLLLAYAAAYLRAVGRASTLHVAARAAGPPDSPSELEMEVRESGSVSASFLQEGSIRPVDPFRLFALVRDLGGRLELETGVSGPLRIVLRLPLPPSDPASGAELSERPAPSAAPRHPSTLSPTATAVAPDRRRAPRISTTLPARFLIGDETWEGTVNNIGLGGAFIVTFRRLPRAEGRPVSVSLKTAVSTLELRGTMHERHLEEAEAGAVGLAFMFDAPSPQDTAVLASFLQASEEDSFSLSLEVKVPANGAPDFRAQEDASEDEERREAIRVRLALPVRLENVGGVGRFLGLAVNISRSGACFQVKAVREALAPRLTVHFPGPSESGYFGSHRPNAPDATFVADLLWSVADSSAPGELTPAPDTPALRIGVRFNRLTPYAEREVNRVVTQHLSTQTELTEPAERTSVVSVARECRNQRDQVIAISDDRPRRPLAPETPVVIVSPGFGQLKTDYVNFAFYLAMNGLRVLRYDPTNHLGQSDGELPSTTLRGFQGDLAATVGFVRSTWPSAPVVVLAADLAGLSALKVVEQGAAVELLLLLNPVMDLPGVITAVHGHDLTADYERGIRRGFGNLFGLTVHLDQFVADALNGAFTKPARILESAANLPNPVILVHTPQPFMDQKVHLDALLESLGRHGTALSVGVDIAIPRPSEGQLAAFAMVLKRIRQTVSPHAASAGTLRPSRRDIARQRRIEAERLRTRYQISHASREGLHAAWIRHLPLLANLSGYWGFIDDLYRALSPIPAEGRLLDLGCGHGELARAVLMNQAYRSRHEAWTPSSPPLYLGIERTQDLAEAAGNTTEAYRRELDAAFSGTLGARPPASMRWLCCDWDDQLPFHDATFDRVVCNLGACFVRSPLHLLRELHRVLRPNGRLVVSCLIPEADLSPIYRRQLRSSGLDEFDPQAQAVLLFTARLREGLRHGLLHGFDRHGLSMLCRQTASAPPHVFTSLQGQALIAILRKGNSSG